LFYLVRDKYDTENYFKQKLQILSYAFISSLGDVPVSFLITKRLWQSVVYCSSFMPNRDCTILKRTKITLIWQMSV